MITLKTLPQATEQQVFDQCALHLVTQNEKSIDDSGSEDCEYHAESGNKCAAGCFIAADEYQPFFEGKTWPQLVARGVLPKEHANLIKALQIVHDSDYPEEWRDALTRLAIQRGLSAAVLA